MTTLERRYQRLFSPRAMQYSPVGETKPGNAVVHEHRLCAPYGTGPLDAKGGGQYANIGENDVFSLVLGEHWGVR